MIAPALIAGLSAAVLTAGLTPAVIRFARRRQFIDDPSTAPDRKQHHGSIPLLGGWGIILAVLAVLWVVAAVTSGRTWTLPYRQLIGLTVAGIILMIGGAADDRKRLSPRQQLIAPILAILTAIVAGIGITEVRNPLGGMIPLDTVRIPIVAFHGVMYHLTLWADIFTGAWLLVTMYATKLLDGLDGLVSGVGVIGSIIVFLLTLRPEVNQPAIGLFALVFGGACAGFLLYNWHPAKIFLGESGSLYVGFILGTLAIIAGGKLATALLILGLPILDLAVVVLYRWLVLHQSPLRTADRSHLHFRLRDAGWSVRRTVLFLYAVIGIFGFSTLLAHGLTKVFILGALAICMAGLVWWVLRRSKSATNA